MMLFNYFILSSNRAETHRWKPQLVLQRLTGHWPTHWMFFVFMDIHYTHSTHRNANFIFSLSRNLIYFNKNSVHNSSGMAHILVTLRHMLLSHLNLHQWRPLQRVLFQFFSSLYIDYEINNLRLLIKLCTNS